MKKKVFAVLGVVCIITILTHNPLSTVLINFLLIGVIPGVHIVIPFWIMMGVYCLLITLITTFYIEDLLATRRSSRAGQTARHLPHRRYSHS